MGSCYTAAVGVSKFLQNELNINDIYNIKVEATMASEGSGFYIAEKMYATYPKEKVVFVEPNVESHKNLPISSKEDAIQQADLFFILVAHNEFEGMSAPNIISFVNI